MDSLLISPQEKHQLILAHAAARRPDEPFQRLMVYGATAICLLFIAGAWISTFGSGIEKIKAQAPPSAVPQDVLESAKRIKEEGLKNGMTILDRAKEEGARVREEQRAIQVLTEELSKTSVSSTSSTSTASF